MLARKISRAKWERRDYLAEKEIRADAITGCLRTSDDTLSWWHCEGEEQDVAEVALALATGPKMTNFDKFDVVVLPEMDFLTAGLTTELEDGDTAIEDLKSRHVNFVRLDVERLAMIARILAPRIRTGDKVFTYTAKTVRALVTTAIHDKRLDADDLNEKLREKLAKPSDAQAS